MCAGSLSAEPCSTVGSSAFCEWVQHAYLGMAGANFDPADIKRRLHNWEEGKRAHEDGVTETTHTQNSQQHLAVTDAKSLYDALRREARGKEPRVAIAVGEIEQSLVVRNCSFRWCPRNVMMADPLSKRLHNASSQLQLQVMKSGHCTRGSELDGEGFERQERELEVIVQRMKSKLLSDEPMFMFKCVLKRSVPGC